MCGLPEGQDAKTSKSPPPLAGLCPQKEFLFLFFPLLIFCFQKQKEKHNVKRIKGLQKYAKKSLHPHIRLTLGLFFTSCLKRSFSRRFRLS